MIKDYYQALGVERAAGQEEIKKVYWQQAKRYHPDANVAEPGNEELFKEINEAYQVLGDPVKRRYYDVMSNSSSTGGTIYSEGFEHELANVLRAMFEINGHTRAWGCRGRGFGKRGCGRKF